MSIQILYFCIVRINIHPYYYTLVFLGIFLTGCIKKEIYPDVPRIEFKSFTKINNGLGYDDKGLLVLSFTDGDGDIGLGSNELNPPYNEGSMYYYNFFITYYEKQKGEFVAVELPFSNNSRIPPLFNNEGEKPLKGDIQVELFINNYLSPYDTIRFQVFIVDRALNHSDTLFTPDIIINKP